MILHNAIMQHRKNLTDSPPPKPKILELLSPANPHLSSFIWQTSAPLPSITNKYTHPWPYKWLDFVQLEGHWDSDWFKPSPNVGILIQNWRLISCQHEFLHTETSLESLGLMMPSSMTSKLYLILMGKWFIWLTQGNNCLEYSVYWHDPHTINVGNIVTENVLFGISDGSLDLVDNISVILCI